MARIGIYAIQNKTNGKIYIGQSTDLEKRIRNHLLSLENNRNLINELQNDFNNGHEINAVILKETQYRKSLLRYESYYCGLYDTVVNGYNGIVPFENAKILEKEITLIFDEEKRKLEAVSNKLNMSLEEFCKYAILEKLYFFESGQLIIEKIKKESTE